MKRVSMIFLGICLLMSCQKSSLDGSDYIKCVEDPSGAFRTEKEMDGLVFRMQYCPVEYMLMNDQRSVDVLSKDLEQRKKEDENMLFFKLRLSSNTNDVLGYRATSDQEYSDRGQYFSFGFEEDIVLVTGADTLSPCEYHFERTYGISPNADFILAFHTDSPVRDDFQVIIDDKIYNTGLLKFTYNYKDIHNIPQLKTL